MLFLIQTATDRDTAAIAGDLMIIIKLAAAIEKAAAMVIIFFFLFVGRLRARRGLAIGQDNFAGRPRFPAFPSM